jgi:hypothetical protein
MWAEATHCFEAGKMSVLEIILDDALERWWDGEFPLQCDRFILLENIGAVHPAKYSRWRWRKLPREIRLLLVSHSMNGRPLEIFKIGD